MGSASASARQPRRRNKRIAAAESVTLAALSVLDPQSASPQPVAEQDRRALAWFCITVLREDAVAEASLERWLSGDPTQRLAVQQSITSRLASNPQLIQALRAMLDALRRPPENAGQQGEATHVPEPPERPAAMEEQRLEQQRLNQQRLEEERLQQLRLEQLRLELRRLEQERIQEQRVRGEGQRAEEKEERFERELLARARSGEQEERVQEALDARLAAEAASEELREAAPRAAQRPSAAAPPPQGGHVTLRGPLSQGLRALSTWTGQAADGAYALRQRLRRPTPHTNSQSRRVSTGIARADGTALDPRWTLALDTTYLYWLSIGRKLDPSRVDVGPIQTLPQDPDLRPGTQLTVVLFPFEQEFIVDPANDVGILELDGKDGAFVVRPVLAGDRGLDRLSFPVHTAARAGVQRVRCNIYHKTQLLQSRVLSAVVAETESKSRTRSLTSLTDYTVASNLDSAAHGIPPRLSLLANRNGSGTHQFRFYGEYDVKGDASIAAEDLEGLIQPIRTALRRASWNTTEEWTANDSYRYEPPTKQSQAEADLIEMARGGRSLWDTLAFELGRGLDGQANPLVDPAPVLRALMRTPGTFEYACPETYRLAIPTGLIYDAHLDSQTKHLSYCPTARESLSQRGTDLLQEPCFSGHCPNYDDKFVMCPSGFWGYRHAIGLPVSLQTNGEGAADAAYVIPAQTKLTIAAALTTDPKFVLLGEHLKRLKNLTPSEDWQPETQRDRVLALLRSIHPHVVYFLCHGAETGGLPGLLVGDPDDPVFITPDNFTEYEVKWPDTRPLVLLNGCRTSALNPTKPRNFVDYFIRRLYASAVIGTEITIFEPLAVRFAEEFLTSFVGQRRTFGDAVRQARLELLREGNPLGLAYVPFGPVSLRVG